LGLYQAGHQHAGTIELGAFLLMGCWSPSGEVCPLPPCRDDQVASLVRGTGSSLLPVLQVVGPARVSKRLVVSVPRAHVCPRVSVLSFLLPGATSERAQLPAELFITKLEAEDLNHRNISVPWLHGAVDHGTA
jgi:hypothetical protein